MMPLANFKAKDKRRRVVLAVTPIGLGFGSFQAYHTSLVVGGTEYSFSDEGIRRAKGLRSHKTLPSYPARTELFEMGLARMEANIILALQIHFLPGTYDLLRKNCNTFTDVALSYLLDRRLDGHYSHLETVGQMANKYTGVVQYLLGDNYTPNPRCSMFSKEDVVAFAKERAHMEKGTCEPRRRRSLMQPLFEMIRCRCLRAQEGLASRVALAK